MQTTSLSIGLSSGGGGDTTELVQRIAAMEDTTYEYELWQSIGSGTSGTISIPEGAVIRLDQYPNAGDCLIVKCDATGRPVDELAGQANGTAITATLDTSGQFVLSGVPKSYPVAVVFQVALPQKAIPTIPLDSIVGYQVVRYTDAQAAAAAPVQAVAGKTGSVVLTKVDVGLGSVDNTADADKPISVATQSALDTKAENTHSHTTDVVAEGSANLYFTAQRVRDAVLAGLSTVTNAAIVATDSVLVAFGKLQAQITLKLDAVNPQVSGNLGIGVAPTTTTGSAANIRRAFFGSLQGGPRAHGYMSANCYPTYSSDPGTAVWRYLSGVSGDLGGATLYEQRGGDHYFYTASTGVAGDPVSWTLRFTVSAAGTETGGNIAHGSDNTWSFGTAARRATTAYLATNPVVGSDARLKCDYSVIPGDIAHELMLKIVPRVGKFIVGGQEPYEVDEATTNEAGEEVMQKVTRYREVPGNRYHTYYLAQEVKAALDSVAERWPQAANLALWVLADVEDVDSIQMVRYEQMIPIIHAASNYRHDLLIGGDK